MTEIDMLESGLAQEFNEESLAESITDTEPEEQTDINTSTEEINSEARIAVLNEEISLLKEELEAYKTAKERQEKIAEQLNEFSALFPEIAVKSIPDEVWDTVKKGNSLTASYALYERKIQEAAKRIEKINSRNAVSSAGIAGKDLPSEYFSPEEVRKMSQSEVRANFAKIKRSMEKWN